MLRWSSVGIIRCNHHWMTNLGLDYHWSFQGLSWNQWYRIGGFEWPYTTKLQKPREWDDQKVSGNFRVPHFTPCLVRMPRSNIEYSSKAQAKSHQFTYKNRLVTKIQRMSTLSPDDSTLSLFHPGKKPSNYAIGIVYLLFIRKGTAGSVSIVYGSSGSFRRWFSSFIFLLSACHHDLEGWSHWMVNIHWDFSACISSANKGSSPMAGSHSANTLLVRVHEQKHSNLKPWGKSASKLQFFVCTCVCVCVSAWGWG